MDPTLLRKLRKLRLPLLPPAMADEIARTEAAIGFPLTAPLKALYRDHNGATPDPLWEYRLMPLKEVAETHSAFQMTALAWLLERLGLVFFWSNDNSDYAGLFLREPFAGLVAILEHDGDPFAISYRRVEHFYSDQIAHYTARLAEEEGEAERPGGIAGMMGNLLRVFGRGSDPVADELRRWYIERPGGELVRPADSKELLEARSRGTSWLRHDVPEPKSAAVPELRDMPRDFAGCGLVPRDSELPLDRERVAILRRLLAEPEASEVEPTIVSSICSFTPQEDSDQLLPFLESNDFFVAELAARSLGLRRWSPAIGALERLVAKGMPNSSGAAAGALRAILPPPSIEALVEQAARSTHGGRHSHSIIIEGLVGHGCEVIQQQSSRAGGEIRYRLPREREWRVLHKPG